ncbi:MAG: hypothetical protein EGQ64_08270, partial [Ruminococcaceae bacterium]|nr:hypothetical protein [Oscillospiraceae bacterium]
MQIRDFLDALQVEGLQDYLLATVLEGEQQGAALLLRGGVPVFGGSSLLAAHLPALQACTPPTDRTPVAVQACRAGRWAASRLLPPNTGTPPRSSRAA